MRSLFITTVAVVLLAGVNPSIAAPEAPEQVVARYHSRFESSRWLALSEFLHPDDLARFKKQFLALFSDENPTTRKTLAELYGPGATIQKLESASPEEFLQPILVMLNQSMDSAGIRVTSQTVLGSVAEGELVHVVYRWQSKGSAVSLSQVEVRTLRQYKDSWCLLLPMNLESTIPAVKRAMQ